MPNSRSSDQLGTIAGQPGRPGPARHGPLGTNRIRAGPARVPRPELQHGPEARRRPGRHDNGPQARFGLLARFWPVFPFFLFFSINRVVHPSHLHPFHLYHTTTQVWLNNHPTKVLHHPTKVLSKVWEFFDEIVVVQDGVEVFKAKCKWPGCTSHLSIGWGGVGHLQRHHNRHLSIGWGGV